MTYKTVGIMVPMPSEFHHYGIVQEPHGVLWGHHFHKVTINGVGCIVGQSGIGKVNMAVATTLMLDHYQPDIVVNAGVGGALAPHLKIGDVVISDAMVCSDYGRVTDGKMYVYQPGNDPFPGACETRGYGVPETVVQTLKEKLGHASGGPLPYDVFWGTIATGDVFVNCQDHGAWLRETLGADAVAMEGAAMAQVAEKYGVPSLEIRAFSDTAQGDSTAEFNQSLALAASNAADLCCRVVGWLGCAPHGRER